MSASITTTTVTPRTAVIYDDTTNASHASSASEKRRKAQAVDYCERMGFHPVELCLNPNSSGFRRPRRNEETLADLLDAARSGLIKPGSVLIVDSLTRPSRENITQMLLQIMELIRDYMIEIHTLPDQQIYNSENIDLPKLVISIHAMA